MYKPDQDLIRCIYNNITAFVCSTLESSNLVEENIFSQTYLDVRQAFL
jgi:hypothetical protein